MRRIISFLVCVVFIGTLLTGCNSNTQNATSKASESKPAEKKSKVVVQFWDLTSRAEVLNQIIADFNKDNPDIEVKLTTNSTDGHKQQLKVAASSKTMPDIWYNWGGTLGDFYPQNKLTYDFTNYAKQNNWEKEFNPAAIKLCTLAGQLAGIPYGLNGIGIYYRKDIFEKYGVKEPKTFEEFEAAAAKLKSNGVTPFSIGGKNGWMTMRWMEALIERYAGPDLHDKLNKFEASWDCSQVEQAYAKFKEWVDKEYFPKGFLTGDPAQCKMLLYNGVAAMQLETPSFEGTLNTDKQDINKYGFFVFPTNQKPQRMSSYTQMFQVSANSPKDVQDAAIKFGLYLTSKEVVEKYAAKLNPLMARNGVNIPDNAPHVKQIRDALPNGNYTVADQALAQEVVQRFFEAPDNIVIGKFSPKQAAEFMQKQIEEYKSKNK